MRMLLLEYEAKSLFEQYNLPLPKGFVATSVNEVATKLGSLKSEKIVVKAQVPIGGRGKAGLVRIVPRQEAPRVASDLLLRNVDGFESNTLRVEEYVEHESERYLGLVVNPAAQRVECIYSAKGGMDVEESVRRDPGLQRIIVNDETDLVNLGVERGVIEVAIRLYRLMRANDARLVEANPLALTRDEKLIVLDAKVELDDNAAFRRPQLFLKPINRLNPLEQQALRAGFHLVKMDGSVSVIANGAGLGMAAMDSLNDNGCGVLSFVDLGGGADRARIESALDLSIQLKPKVILLVAFGGVTDTAQVARAVLNVASRDGNGQRVVAYVAGTNKEGAIGLLRSRGFHVCEDLSEAIGRASALAKEGLG